MFMPVREVFMDCIAYGRLSDVCSIFSHVEKKCDWLMDSVLGFNVFETTFYKLPCVYVVWTYYEMKLTQNYEITRCVPQFFWFN